MKLTLKSIKEEATNTKSFFFEKPSNLNFLPGQYLYYTFSNLIIDDSRGPTRQFTIANSPTENEIRLTTRIRKESGFKQSLNNLKAGESIEAEGPSGSYILDNNLKGPQVMFAGGIGITPFRSFIKYNLDLNLNIPSFLIYSNSDSEFVYKTEIDDWINNYKNLKVHYHDSSKMGHLNEKVVKQLYTDWELNLKTTNTWTTGPKGFVSAIENLLENLKVAENNINTEKFIGY